MNNNFLNRIKLQNTICKTHEVVKTNRTNLQNPKEKLTGRITMLSELNKTLKFKRNQIKYNLIKRIRGQRSSR